MSGWFEQLVITHARTKCFVFCHSKSILDGINDYGKFYSILTIDLSLYPKIILCLRFYGKINNLYRRSGDKFCRL